MGPKWVQSRTESKLKDEIMFPNYTEVTSSPLKIYENVKPSYSKKYSVRFK